MRAYRACIYVRTNTAEGLKSFLLTAKSKVAPLKTKTLHRPELCSAHLLADLYNRVRPLLNFFIIKVFLWTDSEITLAWIKTHPSSLTVKSLCSGEKIRLVFLDIAAIWGSVIVCFYPARSQISLLLLKGSPFVKTYVSYLRVTNCHAVALEHF